MIILTTIVSYHLHKAIYERSFKGHLSESWFARLLAQAANFSFAFACTDVGRYLVYHPTEGKTLSRSEGIAAMVQQVQISCRPTGHMMSYDAS